jgi:FkbM family methyltransferase
MFNMIFLFGWIYKRANNSTGLFKHFWLALRRLILKMYPTASCRMVVHGASVILPFSHALPGYLAALQFYDRLPVRLSEFIGDKCGVVNCIDVGANIGDSIAAFRYGRSSNPNDFYIAVEPNVYYEKYLKLNYSDHGVISLPLLCSKSEGIGFVNFKELNGTASSSFNDRPLEAGDKNIKMTTIDSIVGFYGRDRRFNLLKTDTDGHDFDVISGAKNFIEENLPFIYFEVDSFSDHEFVGNVKNTLNLFLNAGYSKLFIYDNQGYFLGLYEIANESSLEKLLFYKLSKKFYYFDFLLMADEYVDEFLSKERGFYAGNFPKIGKKQ